MTSVQISSASPVTALVSVRSPVTSFATVHLNGSVDWMVAQRRALLAWTGRSLSVKPTINTNLVGLLCPAGMGESRLTGIERGSLGRLRSHRQRPVGSCRHRSVVFDRAESRRTVHCAPEVRLRFPFSSLGHVQDANERSNVVAYTISSNPPRPYRFKSTTLNFQVPGLKSLPRFIQDAKFIRDVSDSKAWKTTMSYLHKFRTWSRMTIWGDRVCPSTGPPSVR